MLSNAFHAERKKNDQKKGKKIYLIYLLQNLYYYQIKRIKENSINGNKINKQKGH